ncbi:MAG: septation protein SpoVG family protein [[Clostridium] innocuum]|nr:septation protein SpoVG family protein [[Clostridium] innocuum]MBS5685886.1 septation protein SpoVG family protein [[Clostridium] innocuum]
MTKKQNVNVTTDAAVEEKGMEKNVKQEVPAFDPKDFKINVRLRNDHAYILADVDIIYGCMKMSGAHIMDGKKGPYVQMAQTRTPRGDYRDTFYPLSGEARNGLNQLIKDEYIMTAQKMQARIQHGIDNSHAQEENIPKPQEEPAPQMGQMM